MAARVFLLLFLLIVFASAAAAADADACSSASFSNRDYASCNDLPQLGASLHWSYHSASGNLSVAFVAPPGNPEGWVAWGINPYATGMIGTQALIAFRQADGKMVVKTYNVSSYGPVAEGPIAFDPSDLAADVSGGNMQIFAKMTLPTGTTAVNQVWQVGAAVADGVPQRHDLKEENKDSKGKLDLVKGGATSPPSAPSPPASTPPTAPPAASGAKNVSEDFRV